MADRGQSTRGDRRRQGGCEDKAWRVTAQKIDEHRRAGNVAADRTEGFPERALDHGRAVHDPIALGDAAAAWPVEPDRVHLVKIGHRAKTLGDVANFADRGDVAIHRIHRLEADELWPVTGHAFE